MNLENCNKEVNELIPSKRWDSFHCVIGIHRAKLIQIEDIVAQYPSNHIIGKVYVSRCTVCGKIITKYVHLKNSL